MNEGKLSAFDDLSSREIFQRNRKAIIVRNTMVMRIVLLSTIPVFGVQLLISYLTDAKQGEKMFYFTIILLLIGLHVFMERFSFCKRMTFFYALEALLMVYCIFISAIIWPDELSVEVLAVILLFPIIFIDKWWRITLVTFVFSGVYLIAVLPYKVEVLRMDEVVDVVCFMILGSLIGYFTRKSTVKSMELLEKVRMSEEQYRLVLTHSGSLMCRYNVTDHTVTLGTDVAAYLDLPSVLENVPYSQVEQGKISPETSETYIAFFEGIMQGGKCGMTSFCTQTLKGWRWMNARYTTIFAADDTPVYAVISLKDVTEQREQAVCEAALRETDELTGTLSYEAFEQYAQLALSEDVAGEHALLLLDVDHFQEIFKQFGQHESDGILQDFAQDMQSILRSEDLVGRVRGDQFMIFLRGIASENVEKRVNSICKALYRQLSPDMDLSVSIGVVIYPRDGMKYDSLCRKAEQALRAAKEKGRDCYIIYNG